MCQKKKSQLFVSYITSQRESRPAKAVNVSYQMVTSMRSFLINIGKRSSKDADIVNILKDSLKGTLKVVRNGVPTSNGNLLVLGLESKRCEPLATFFT